MKHIRIILQIYKLQGLLKIQKNPAFLKKKYLSLFLYSTYVPHNTYYVVQQTVDKALLLQGFAIVGTAFLI